MAFGTYLEVGLAEAREQHRDARKRLGDGVDPTGQRKKDKLVARLAAETTFEGIARE